MCEDPLVGGCRGRGKDDFYIPFVGKTKRGMEWIKFAALVLRHVENYTVPQYGDAPDDLVSELDAHDCIPHLQKYATRAGKGQRGREQEKLDMLKIAHWACMRLTKMEEEDASVGRA